MGVTPLEFLFSQDGAGNSFKITLPELIDSIGGGAGGVYGPSAASAGIEANALAVIQRNAKRNWADAAVKSVLFSGSMAIGKKVTKKPRAAANRLLKQFGLGDLVRV